MHPVSGSSLLSLNHAYLLSLQQVWDLVAAPENTAFGFPDETSPTGIQPAVTIYAWNEFGEGGIVVSNALVDDIRSCRNGAKHANFYNRKQVYFAMTCRAPYQYPNTLFKIVTPTLSHGLSTCHCTVGSYCW